MSTEMIAAFISIVAIVIAGYSVWRASQAGTPITGSLLTATLQESTTSASELTDAGLTAARAAQQLYQTGKITRDERLNYAFDYVKKWFPDLDQERILTAIEAGVMIVNTIVASLPDGKSDTPPALPAATLEDELRNLGRM